MSPKAEVWYGGWVLLEAPPGDQVVQALQPPRRVLSPVHRGFCSVATRRRCSIRPPGGVSIVSVSGIVLSSSGPTGTPSVWGIISSSPGQTERLGERGACAHVHAARRLGRRLLGSRATAPRAAAARRGRWAAAQAEAARAMVARAVAVRAEAAVRAVAAVASREECRRGRDGCLELGADDRARVRLLREGRACDERALACAQLRCIRLRTVRARAGQGQQVTARRWRRRR
jgi:hypothetical protein